MTNGRRSTAVPDHLRQRDDAYRFDWGPSGLRALAPDAAVVIIVDVLRFSTAVSAAVESGAEAIPYRWEAGDIATFAAERGATIPDGDTLSPTELLSGDHGARIVIRAPNGAAMAEAASTHGADCVLVGCLRNAAATAHHARSVAGGGPVAVIAAGERWHGGTGPLRPAVEDLIGAGAILAALDPSAATGAPRCSPEAAAARAAFLGTRPLLDEVLARSASGVALTGRGRSDDIAMAAALDVTDLAAERRGDGFIGVRPYET